MASPGGQSNAEAEGWRVIHQAVRVARERLGDRISAQYALGSLAHGGFAPAVSDIDVAFLVDRCDPAVVDALIATRETVMTSSASALAARLSLFWSDWEHFSEPTEYARFPAVDRLDLMEHGKLLGDNDQRDVRGVRPSRDELVESTRDFLRGKPLQHCDPRQLAYSDTRTLTKTVLFPARFLYTFHTGRAGANHDATNWYRTTGAPAAALTDAAVIWRAGEVDRRAAERLIGLHLDDLQAECAGAFGAPYSSTQRL